MHLGRLKKKALRGKQVLYCRWSDFQTNNMCRKHTPPPPLQLIPSSPAPQWRLCLGSAHCLPLGVERRLTRVVRINYPQLPFSSSAAFTWLTFFRPHLEHLLPFFLNSIHPHPPPWGPPILSGPRNNSPAFPTLLGGKRHKVINLRWCTVEKN